MKFELLSHSSLRLEHAGTSVLVDPWLLGPSYHGAWALLPEPHDLLARLPRPDWILFSHGHPDHFHQQTLAALLQRFGNRLTALVPRHALPHLRRAALAAGFADVREVPLGRDVELGRDFSLRLYAMRADDSLHVFRAGGTTLVNANDCTPGASLCAAVARAAPNPDFYFGQFSAGDAYPFALDGLGADELREAAAVPARRMIDWAIALRARCAVPIGGFVRFAHRENDWMNAWCTRLDDVGGDARIAVERLWPGDGWSDADGFQRHPSHREIYRDAFAAASKSALPLSPRRESPSRAHIESAAMRSFGSMFEVTPRFLRRRIGRLGFHLEDLDASLVADFDAARLEWRQGPPDGPHFRLGAAHFTETCLAPGGWSEFHVAARFRVQRWRESHAVELFLPLSILCDLGYPGARWRDLLAPRALTAWWSRRWEAVDVLRRFARRGGEPFARP